MKILKQINETYASAYTDLNIKIAALEKRVMELENLEDKKPLSQYYKNDDSSKVILLKL